ncbi:nucleotidyltransferase domain-containing protein [Oceanihabitans sp. 2_MG-2023]|uniref:nucleotidyltransferase domain-containing protein n=1 Tax=Oceanihabitans sp. 2_MG-2023 TaxID=3062661 RepID=UPI0026E136DF|nr:nucleotidyltransferase domain-containing protein [Oceanihabitans sp. 2_MG-2023]MDO6596403.1 nucleotidyltransferase domain-containing protein [Oceanihabitans sp. 2_MG-2023]
MESLKAILYFSIFNYPLTKDEIFKFSKTEKKENLETDLQALEIKKVIKNVDGYYIYKDPNSIVNRRLKGNQHAKQVLPKAFKRGQFIAKFPYVESVSLSGGLSKGYYDDDGDFDFFIITKDKRLWIARTLLIIYKKVFLRNNKKHFCVNYFISNTHLEIHEKNLFTATELMTLIPVTGKTIFKKFIANNTWPKTYLPNITITNLETIKEVKKPILTKSIEALFNTKLGNTLEAFFRKLTLNKWKKKFTSLSKKELEIAMKSTTDVSKHHPQNFQKKVIHALNKKYLEVQEQHDIILEPEHD